MHTHTSTRKRTHARARAHTTRTIFFELNYVCLIFHCRSFAYVDTQTHTLAHACTPHAQYFSYSRRVCLFNFSLWSPRLRRHANTHARTHTTQYAHYISYSFLFFCSLIIFFFTVPSLRRVYNRERSQNFYSSACWTLATFATEVVLTAPLVAIYCLVCSLFIST